MCFWQWMKKIFRITYSSKTTRDLSEISSEYHGSLGVRVRNMASTCGEDFFFWQHLRVCYFATEINFRSNRNLQCKNVHGWNKTKDSMYSYLHKASLLRISSRRFSISRLAKSKCLRTQLKPASLTNLSTFSWSCLAPFLGRGSLLKLTLFITSTYGFRTPSYSWSLGKAPFERRTLLGLVPSIWDASAKSRGTDESDRW